MKSRKKVSRKKTTKAKASRKTSVRRNSKRTHSGRRRFTRIKRGGTITAPVIQRLRTFMVHKMRPLIYQARPNIYVGHDPQAADGSITNVNDRFYPTFADITFEDGDIKDSIQKFIEEVQNPVKNADKLKSIKGKYDAIMKKLDDEERKLTKGLMVVGTRTFEPVKPTPRENIKRTYINVGPGAAAASGGESPLGPFINPPFSSPNIQRNPDYSTKPKTPLKPLSKKDTFRDDYDIDETGTHTQTPTQHISFLSRLDSPPPPSANDEERLLGPDDAKTLDF